MAQTITQKILALHCSQDEVAPGEYILADADLFLANDITAPLAIREFTENGGGKVTDREKVVFVLDHFTPARDVKSAEQASFVRNFAREQGLSHFYPEGKGIEHALLPEEGLVLPGEVVIGADSHTCTYGALGTFSTGVGSTDLAYGMITGKVWLKVPETIRFIYRGKVNKWVGGKDLILFTIGDVSVDGANYCAMEFSGEAVDSLGMDDRFTMANMAIEAGAKNGIFAPDEKTRKYLEGLPRKKPGGVFHVSDPGAPCRETREYDVSKLEPQVAAPPSPGNVRPVSEFSSVNIDQVVIGSCTNGRLSDLRAAASVINGRKVHDYLRLIVIPATEKIYHLALREGLLETFIEAGAIISPPTCGPCLGGHMGVLAAGEKAVATTNRNFIGRMGHVRSEVYLANPAVCAASAVKGRIVSPDELS